MRRWTLLLAVAMMLACPVVAGAQATSTEAAAALAAQLDTSGRTAFAAADPAEPGRYVAVMYMPGLQLLVISGVYPVPVLLDPKLERGEYQQVYMDLHGASTVDSQWFVQDLLADGIRADRKPGAAFDLVSRKGASFIAIDGDWAGQKLSEAEYRERVKAAEEMYTRMLRVLLTSLKAHT